MRARPGSKAKRVTKRERVVTGIIKPYSHPRVTQRPSVAPRSRKPKPTPHVIWCTEREWRAISAGAESFLRFSRKVHGSKP